MTPCKLLNYFLRIAELRSFTKAAAVPTYIVLADDVSTGHLTAAPIEDLSVTWTVVHSRERALGLAAQKLVELLLEVTARAAESGRWPGVTLL